jgi:ankyrin repeat protein
VNQGVIDLSATPLIDGGEPEPVRALLAARADITLSRADGATPASARGQLECARAVPNAGADIAHAVADGKAALAAASREGHLECVRALVEAGADVAQATPDGWTSLMDASERSHLKCRCTLLDAGADVMQRDAAGIHALDCTGESLETLQLLCAYAPSREAVRAHLGLEEMDLEDSDAPLVCAPWLAATRRWTSQLHHF